jgi:hypothetical protein
MANAAVQATGGRVVVPFGAASLISTYGTSLCEAN